ncbi:GNAT family N-acetyltransferase [Legionella cincinnatiensis]|uniref:N-acyl amino acid synthase FeeM catalytic core domain-containing protein n=1 Tax=Legionella cincinnatiensis TaxID=28085 RepID=A0A378IFJ6_9GAMM|nr:GNAT family N-acetyltransferase [Legionella cincinnatiensis]KTC92180.1 hypothetical protein Lcin_0959 [Legionella cincinnatiensis]STX33515.1 Uncharacterised protein [Legionella cincinnatiensis]
MKEHIDIKLVSKRDTQQRERIFRLRYYIFSQVYKHHTPPGMNHELQLFSNQIDDISYLFLASINDNPVGTLRVTPFSCLESSDNFILKDHKVPAHYLTGNCALFSFFCILPEYHHTSVSYCLLQTVLTHAKDKNIQRIFIEAHEEMVPYYQHYQFSPCSDWIKPEGYEQPVIAMTIQVQSLINLEG